MHGSSNWKEISTKTAIAALGIIAQFPLMVLVYYGNGENLAYPILSGVCEASFTILSLLLTFQSSQKAIREGDPELDREKEKIIGQIDQFLKELPTQYKDPEFIRTIEEHSDSLWELVQSSERIPTPSKGSTVLSNGAKAIGLFIACYITTVNGAVSYKGVKAWREDQEVLAILTTIFVSLANIKLLSQLCMDSAVSSYESLRDLANNQYRLPLGHAVSPLAWWIGRVFSNAVALLSFGTTATAAGYIPRVGNGLIAPAPFSSALLLNEHLNWTMDDLLLWTHSQCNPIVKKATHLNHSLTKFKEKIQDADSETLRQFLSFEQLSTDVTIPLL